MNEQFKPTTQVNAFSFDAVLDAAPADIGRVANARISINESEIDTRLKFYQDYSDGFKVTHEHRDTMLAIFRDHRNVFVTGGAGTGKTTFIRDIVIPELNHRNLNFAVTASTGIAGSHLDGRTVHSWFGIGLGPEWLSMDPSPQDMPPEMLTEKYQKAYDSWLDDPSIRPNVRSGVISRITGVEVLLIDEISMCAGDALLGYLDFMMRSLRSTDEPFGGVQVIFIGDFAQIPPVEKRKDIQRPDWAFLSKCWQDANVYNAELTIIFRQEDKKFATFLNRIRVGLPVDIEYVRSFVKTLTVEEVDGYTFLVPTNAFADMLNEQALDRFESPTYLLDAEFHIEPELLTAWEKPYKVRQQLERGRIEKPCLALRIGAPVLFTVNNASQKYFNGTRGFIREVRTKQKDDLGVDTEDLVIVGIPDGPNGKERLIELERFEYCRNRRETPEQKVTLQDPKTGRDRETYRYPVMRQFPLIPATAITIHRSQGMSMDKVIVHVRNTFAPGQVYVGLSRLRTPEGLVLTGEEFEAVVDPHVLQFYRNIRAQKEITNG